MAKPIADIVSKMNLHRALSDIAEIRAQLDRTETYRGFRSATVGVSVVFLVIGAWVQSWWITKIEVQIDRYLTIWFWVAFLSAACVVIEMLIRSRISGNRLVAKMHWSLLRHITPCLLVGIVLTFLIEQNYRETLIVDGPPSTGGLIWALPGLWSMIYSLGLLHCRRDLPVQTLGVAFYFLMSGLMLLVRNWEAREVDGMHMLATFGVGQTLLAIVLFWNLERRRG